MKTVLDLPKTPATTLASFRVLDRLSKQALFSKLKTIKRGWIEVEDETGLTTFGDPASSLDHRTRVQIHNMRAYTRIALGGSVGTADAFIDGDWSASHLVGLIRVFVLNRETLNSLDSGLGQLFSPFLKFLHNLRTNDINGSKQNISAHYDLSNDFFGLFLDPSRMYSAAYYPTATSTLEEAQFEKNDRICRKLRLKPTDHLIEIGTGWGGFAIHAATHYGCQVTTTTISKAQFDYAREEIKKRGLENKITLLFEDYRNLTGQFDKLVSIEMIEAVGLGYLDGYFKKCASLLKPEGAMVLQSILIQDQYFEQAAKSVDFIQTHVFPGSAIPSVTRIQNGITENTDLKLAHFEDFGLHYAFTLHEWDQRLESKKSELNRLGFDERLYRLWKYYFAYCEGGFLERQISVAHLTFTKPLYRDEPIRLEKNS